jgi:hypothetical protein
MVRAATTIATTLFRARMQISFDPVVVLRVPEHQARQMQVELSPSSVERAPGAGPAPGEDRTMLRTVPPTTARRPSLPLGERLLLGVPSLLLGIVPLLAPHTTARVLGLADVAPAYVVRAVGVRELVVAAAFLRGRSTGWLWGFVGQDALDLPVLVWLLATGRGDGSRLRRALAGYLAMATVDVSTAAIQDLVPRRRQRRAAAPFVPSEPSSTL